MNKRTLNFGIKEKRVFSGLAAAIIAVLLLGACSSSNGGASEEFAKQGSVAPPIELRDVSGNLVKLADFKGHPVIVNFWATWCPSCKIEMPEIAAVLKQYQSDGLVVLGIDPGEDISVIQNFVSAGGFTWTMLVDSGSSLKNSYHIAGYPSTFFIDRGGLIQASQIGGMDREGLAEKIAKIL